MNFRRSTTIAILLQIALAGIVQAQPRDLEPKDFTAGMLASPRFEATLDGGSPVHAELFSATPESAKLTIGGRTYNLTKEAGTPYLVGKTGKGLPIKLEIRSRTELAGTIGDQAVSLVSKPNAPLSPKDVKGWDVKTPADLQKLIDAMPSYKKWMKSFWADDGPAFYMGRTDGSAKVMVIMSDPGPATNQVIVPRSGTVGDASQRLAGFLKKLGLMPDDHAGSYNQVNAFQYPLDPSKASAGAGNEILLDPAMRAWRDEFYSRIAKGPDGKGNLEAIIVMGAQARQAFKHWQEDSRPEFRPPAGVKVVDLPHPSSHDPKALVDKWRAGIEELRKVVTPDVKGPLPENYGAEFTEWDYSPVSTFDVPKGTPLYLLDNSDTRLRPQPYNNWVRRGSGSDLIVEHPDGSFTTMFVTPDPTGEGYQHDKPVFQEVPGALKRMPDGSTVDMVKARADRAAERAAALDRGFTRTSGLSGLMGEEILKERVEDGAKVGAADER